MAEKDPTKPDSHNKYLMMKPGDAAKAVAKDLEALSSEETGVERGEEIEEHLTALSDISVKYLNEKFPEYDKEGKKLGPKRRGLGHVKNAAEKTAHAESLAKRHVQYLKEVSYVNAAIAEGKTGKDLDAAKKKAKQVAKDEVENKQFVKDFFNLYLRNNIEVDGKNPFKDYNSFVNYLASSKGLRGDHGKGNLRKVMETALVRMHHTTYKNDTIDHALEVAESDKALRKEYLSVLDKNYLADHGLKSVDHAPVAMLKDYASAKVRMGKRFKPIKDDNPEYLKELPKAA